LHIVARERVAFNVEYSARVAFKTAFMGCLMCVCMCVGGSCVILRVLDCQARTRGACSRFRIRRSIPRSIARHFGVTILT